ncbi:hypothetical protein N7499_011591 [Penicillium canescens]|uniref:Stc1 domain-containing protein n=1 Tax=Penicillium canescens TaxID=5083 RepID=A0AAD6IL12_PENCN|nr:uncharacterized protein N7446_006850 [Penicillium canescens]KAJ6052208.1 hypothetical protein N7460_002742 [Penicillium canescens]KAJ6062730.1 hypothetical protein N7446_006850 [Penicillium canescens]KAJ6069704.1 hypothetical protein N7499_011591 [Penicillium canescens]KAJ6182244.1 hypothetical protein N7485_000886 [Penicillium canescens]
MSLSSGMNNAPENALAQTGVERPFNDFPPLVRFVLPRTPLEKLEKSHANMMTTRRKRPSKLYPRGYDEEVRQALDRIDLPALITCCVCHSARPQFEYSSNQLSYLREAIFDEGFDIIPIQEVAKCVTCSQTQVVELKCNLCGHYRGIDYFSRNQRSRETPNCQPCMDYQMSIDPEAEMIAMQSMCEEGNKSGSRAEVDAVLALADRDESLDEYENAVWARRNYIRSGSASDLPVGIPSMPKRFARIPSVRHHMPPLPAPKRAPSPVRCGRTDESNGQKFL